MWRKISVRDPDPKSGSTCFWASWIRIQILLSLSKNSKKKPWFLLFCDFFFLSFKNDVMYLQKVICRKTFLTKLVFLASWRSMMKTAGSGSISQRHLSADPDPHKNVMDPQHCGKFWQGSGSTLVWLTGPGSGPHWVKKRIWIPLKPIQIRNTD